MQNEDQFLCLSMYTYLDLLKYGEQVIQFVERALDLVKPFSHSLQVQPWYPGGTPGRISSWNQPTQRRVRDQLLAGELESLHIAQQDWDNSFIPPQIKLELELAAYSAYHAYQSLRYPMLPQEYNDQNKAKSLNLSINHNLLSPESHLRLFEALVGLGLWTLEMLEAVYGFVALDQFGRTFSQTSYEERHSLDYTRDVARVLYDKGRGVFHVNFLTSGHLTALGNVAPLASLPAVMDVKSMKTRSRDVLLLRVGDARTPLANKQVQAIEEQLKPILPQSPVRTMVDLLNPDIAQEIDGAVQELEAILAPKQVVTMPNGGVLVFHWYEKSNPTHQQAMDKFRQVVVIYQRHLNSIPWRGPVFGDVYPGWNLFRIGRHGKHLNRLPYILCSSLIDAKPFGMTLWLRSKPSKRTKQALADLFAEWAGFEYPDYVSEEPAIDLLDVRFQECEVTVRAEIRAHRGFALATLISMLDLFALKQAPIKDLVLGQIEDLDFLLAKAAQSRDSLAKSGNSQESEPQSTRDVSLTDQSPQPERDPQTKADLVDIPIVIGDIFEPPDIPITIRFAYPPDEAQQAALEELLYAWFLEGQNEHFGPGFFHSATSLVFEDDLALWHVDVGGASGDALLILKSRLEVYSKAHVPIREIILGTNVNE